MAGDSEVAGSNGVPVVSTGDGEGRSRQRDSALRCLEFMLRHHGLDYGIDYLHHEYASEAPIDAERLCAFARRFGVKARRQTFSGNAPGALP